MVTNSIIEEEILQVKRNPWADNFFRPLLLTIMMMCFNISLVNLVRLFNPAWRGTYFLIGMLLVTVEAIYSYRILKLYRPRDTSIWRYRTAEWVVLILILKTLSYANKPMAFIVADLQAMWQNPLNVVSLEFYVMLLLAFGIWTAATNTIADFEALYDPFTLRTGTSAPLERLATRFFWGGIFLVFISGVSQLIVKFGLSSLTNFRRPTLGGIIINVLVYFGLGLVLLSQANLARLMLRWRVQRIEFSPGLVKQWAKYGFMFLGLITFVVFFLPTGYTMGFLTSAGVVLGIVINVLVLLVQLLLFLIILPFMLLLSLVLGDTPRNTINIPMQPFSVMDAAANGASAPWWEALRSLIFWLLALAIGWYLVKVYLSERPELLQSLKRFKPIDLIVNLLKQLWQWLTGVAQTGLEMMSERIKLPTQAGDTTPFTGGWNWFGLMRRLSARERILYYYLNILKRVEKLGPARQAHQTPYEYEPDLGQTVPEARTEVHELTDVFVRARYSREGFSEEQATSVKRQWQRIRQALRNLFHSNKASHWD